MEPGYIYILKNPALKDDLLKIGMTTRSPHERIAELSNSTGVPAQFELNFVEWVPDCQQAERLLHARLDKHRYAKEFFCISLNEAITVARDVADSLRALGSAQVGSHSPANDVESTGTDVEIDVTASHQDPASSTDPEAGLQSEMPSRDQARRSSFRATQRHELTCSRCGEVFWVTFKRYEDKTVCPRCRALIDESLSW